jgi:site-specific recombinase XerD
MGRSLDGAVLPGLKSQILPHLSHIFAVTAIQKGIYLLALEHLLGHDALTTTGI